MARKRTANIDPIGRMPELIGAFKQLGYLGDVPLLDAPGPLGLMEHDKPNPSVHPNKSNPGGPMRYYGSDA